MTLTEAISNYYGEKKPDTLIEMTEFFSTILANLFEEDPHPLLLYMTVATVPLPVELYVVSDNLPEAIEEFVNKVIAKIERDEEVNILHMVAWFKHFTDYCEKFA